MLHLSLGATTDKTALTASPQARAVLAPFIKSAAGQHGISGTDLKGLPIPLPPKAHQVQIVAGIRRSFSSIDDVVADAGRAAKLLDRLDEAILAKAFRGELSVLTLQNTDQAKIAAE